MSFSLVEPDGGDRDIVAEINVTPLTDIFLVLLIIFMVTSTALTQQGTKVNLPRGKAGSSAPSGVVLTATADRRVEVNGKAVPIDALGQALAEALRKTDDHSVILQGDRDVVLDEAVQLMTIAKEAGAEKIAIATAPADQGRH